MAAYQDKILVNDAITDNTKLDLQHQHITTANFMQMNPIMVHEMVPGEKINCSVETLSRMNPMPVPTYGRANIKNAAYFVPFRTIFRGWSDFVTDAPHVNSMNNTEQLGNILNTVPIVKNNTLVSAFTDVSYNVNGNSYAALASGSSTNYDIILNTGSSVVYKKFGRVGQQLLKVLESLGYKIQWNVNDDTPYSALPLLAFTKIYLDWYFPQDYTNTDIYNYLYLLCNADTGVGLELNKTDVGRILQFVYTCYDSDYFVSAWDNPNSPNDNTYSTDFKLVNIDTIGQAYGRAVPGGASFTVDLSKGYVTNYDGNANSSYNSEYVGKADAPFISSVVKGVQAGGSNTATYPAPISQYMLNALHSLTDYMKRHQLAGSTSFQRYLSRFGKALSAEKMNRSIFLGTETTPLQIGDVMCTAQGNDASNPQLAEYAGKGIAYGNGGFEYSTDEYGLFIIVSTIVPAVGYYQGLDRTVKHISKLDFWTPEFDSLGVQPITADELYMSYDGSSDFGSNNNGKAIHTQVFGFTPRYAEYKCAKDQVTGNFRIPSLNGDAISGDTAFNGSSSWHLMRKFDDADFDGVVSGIVHSVDFCYARNDYGQFNRIFYNQEWNAPDQFTLIHNFNCVSYAPMKSLYDTYEFEDKGKKVTMQANGVIKN